MAQSKSRLVGWLILIVVISLSLNIYLGLVHKKTTAPGSQGSAAATIYTCPMHPQVIQDHPGDCPICGMKLVKRSGGQNATTAIDTLAGGVKLSSQQEALIDVKIELPQRTTFTQSLTVPGRIVAREEASWKAGARVMSRIEKLYVATPGQAVRKGDPLFTLYSPDLAAVQREYLLARQNSEPKIRETLIEGAKSKLASLGIEPDQLAELERGGEVKETLTFHAADNGALMEKMASAGEWIMPGMTIMDFTDLSQVWVEGTLYEKDLGKAKLGDAVQVQAVAYPELETTGTVSYIAPMLDMMTRTLPFRATLDNRDLKWKLEMFVQIALGGNRQEEHLSVPEDAILSTGKMNIVWVKVAEGRFQPRMVNVGINQNGRTAILSGIAPTDEIVISGGYLIDSDAQIRGGGAQSMPGMDMSSGGKMEEKPTAQPAAPVQKTESMESMPGMESPAKKAEPTQKVEYTCPMHPEIIRDQPGNCPICGMTLVKKGG